MSRRIIICIIFFVISVVADQLGPTVTISNGKVRGAIQQSAKGNDFYSFEGIPYAAPPVGNRRFKSPEKPENWTGILEATNNKHVCLQPKMFADDPHLNPIGTEDCLYLNVYTPAKLNNEDVHRLSVLVWLHGGAFQYESKDTMIPHYLMDYDIIVVAINYRVGVLGFLSTQDSVIPGNFGLKDQQFALRWVSQNIQQFGGDPDKVTIAGQSAGSISVSYQLLATNNEGLFRGVIQESGSALCQHDFQQNPKPVAYHLGKLVDPEFSGNSEDLLKILRQVEPNKLIELANSSFLWSQHLPPYNPAEPFILKNYWLPVIENINDTESIITTPMHQAFREGKFLKVPMIVGFNSEESIKYLALDEGRDLSNAKKIDYNPELLVTEKFNIKNKFEAAMKIKAIYADSFAKDPSALARFLTDNLYRVPVLRQAELVNKYVPVYVYQLSYKHTLSKDIHIDGAERVGHGGDKWFIFAKTEYSDKTDKLVHERFVKLWTNFIKFQDPNFEDDPILIKWPKTTSNLEYLNINSTLEVLDHPKVYAAWKKILDEYMSPPFWVY